MRESGLVHSNKLLRILGLGFGLAVVVGGTIGVSIFRLPGPTASLLGNPWLILAVWTLGGVFTLLNANYMAELATMIPMAGGPYVAIFCRSHNHCTWVPPFVSVLELDRGARWEWNTKADELS